MQQNQHKQINKNIINKQTNKSLRQTKHEQQFLNNNNNKQTKKKAKQSNKHTKKTRDT